LTTLLAVLHQVLNKQVPVPVQVLCINYRRSVTLQLHEVKVVVSFIFNKMLSYRRETVLQDALQFTPKIKDWNWETIFYWHYRSIFNHCDIIGLKICQIW